MDTILEPGSSLHPIFLLALDGVLATLLFTLIGLLYITGNLHVFALICIELGLWASIKWYVYELQNAPPIQNPEKAKAE